jgi:PAS domain S-box-containing protein
MDLDGMVLDSVSASSLLEALPDAALVIDADGRILTGNSATNGLLATDHVPVGANIVDFLPEQERRRLNPLVWLRRWAEQPQAPELAHVRLWCRDRTGAEKAVRVRVGTLATTPPSYLVMLVDVTAEQARQYRTRSAHRLAARVLAISADAIVNVDDTLRIVYVNPSAETLFGYLPGSLVGEPLATLLPERYRADHQRFMSRFAGEAAPSRLMGQRAEIRGLTRDGEEVPLEASITKVTTDRGLVFSAHLRDLRPRHAAEAELRRADARFRTVFEHARQAMALIATDGRVEAMNAAARLLLPADVEPVGKSFAGLPFFSDDPHGTADELAAAMNQVLAGEPYRTSAAARLPDGQEHRLDFTLSPVMSDEGVFAVIAEAHDLTGPSV